VSPPCAALPSEPCCPQQRLQVSWVLLPTQSTHWPMTRRNCLSPATAELQPRYPATAQRLPLLVTAPCCPTTLAVSEIHAAACLHNAAVLQLHNLHATALTSAGDSALLSMTMAVSVIADATYTDHPMAYDITRLPALQLHNPHLCW
jgi:hypothetical protein